MDIPIVAVAYNRPDSLSRLLSSLNAATYPANVKLYISIDGGGSESVRSVAEKLDWQHGVKEILSHQNNLGLRNHILSCGDLALKHDGIIVLEDDLFVSKAFYQYVKNGLTYYKSEKHIAGISLYAHSFNETAQLPFVPINDHSDVFFLQLASSWGQCWTKNQWKDFKRWYGKKQNEKLSLADGVPSSVIKWPDTSWKKFFIKYMIEKNLFFLYPRISLSTNFGDDGMNHLGDNHYQVPLYYSDKKFAFIKFSKSYAKYDSYCELLPECLNMLTELFSSFDYTVDLYGSKPLEQIKTDYLLSSRGTVNPIHSFGRKMIPHETNVVEDIKGDKIQFTSLPDAKSPTQGYTNARVVYYHKLPRWHLKEKKAEQDKPATLTEREETLLRIHAKKVGKILFTPLIFMHKLYIIVRKMNLR